MIRMAAVAAAGLLLAGCADMWGMDQQEAAVVEEPGIFEDERFDEETGMFEEEDEAITEREWLLEEEEFDDDPFQ